MKILLCILLISAVHASSIKENIDKVVEKHPRFINLLKLLQPDEVEDRGESNTNDDSQDGDFVDMKHYLNTIFRFWNFKGTPFGDIVKGGQLPDMESFGEKFGVVNMLNRLENDPNLQKAIAEMISDHIATQQFQEPLYQSKEDSFEDEDIQTDGYEGCKMDYDSLVEPITTPLINAVWDVVRVIAQNRNLTLPENPPAAIVTERDMEPWGWLMFDALAKVPEGISEGKLHWVGSYELCNRIEANYNFSQPSIIPGRPPYVEKRSFKAKYCRLDFNPANPLIGNGTDFLRFQLGICVPDTCSAENISTYVTEPLQGNLVLGALNVLTGLRLDEVYCGQVTDYESDPDIQAAVAIILTLFTICILATLYDGLMRPSLMKPHTEAIQKKQHLARSISQISQNPDVPEALPVIGPGDYDNAPAAPKPAGLARQTSYHEVDKEEQRRYSIGSSDRPPLNTQISTSSISPLVEELTANQIEQDKPTLLDRLEVVFVGFSAYSNLRRIFKTDNCIEDEMPALNGVRFLSWAYAIYGHAWIFGLVYNECWTTSNLLSAVRTLPRKWSFQPVINHHFSGDAFFVISGCLVTYWWLKKYEQMKRLSVGMIVKFYLQRYWILMPALMFVLMTYATTYRYLGSGPLFPVNVSDADNCKTNWWTDLLLVHNLVNVDKMCLTWTWYVGIIWQLHIITPLVLIPLVLWPVVGYIALGALYVTHVGATAGVVSNIIESEDEGVLNWAADYFFTPWCRAGPYFVGMALGIILYTKKLKVKMPIFVAILGWVVAMVCICSVEYATYGILKKGGSRWDKGTRVMYDTFARTSYGVGVAWIIFACVTGYGGFIDTILSWKVFIPLSRITYPSYLIHTMMIFTFVYGQYSLLYVNESNVMYWFFAHLWVIHIVGLFFVGLLCYYPLSVGVIRAFKVKTKFDCVKAGCHPAIEDPLPLNGVNDMDKHAQYNVPSISSISQQVSGDLRQRKIHAQNTGNAYEELRAKNTTPDKAYEELKPKKTTEF